MLLTLLTMISWAETEVTAKVHPKHNRHHYKAHTKRSEQDIDGKNLSKYTIPGLKVLIKLFKACIERNEIKDPEDLEHRLAYQKKRGGKTPCGVLYSELTMSHYLNILEEDSAEMRRDIQDAEAELKKRGHPCGCNTRG